LKQGGWTFLVNIRGSGGTNIHQEPEKGLLPTQMATIWASMLREAVNTRAGVATTRFKSSS